MKRPLWRDEDGREGAVLLTLRGVALVGLFLLFSLLSHLSTGLWPRLMEWKNGYYRRADGYVFHLPHSELGVTEWGQDTTGDGHLDTWYLEAGNDQYKANYRTEDLDVDGKRDMFVVEIGEEGRLGGFRTVIYDRAEQGRRPYDHFNLVWLGGCADPERRFFYADYDFDGGLDALFTTHEDGRLVYEIRVGRRWIPATHDEKANGFRAIGEDGQERPYAYDFDAKSFVPQE